EMLNRTELSSQGAKARRVLMEAMITNADLPGLGLDGFGPEVAMYLACLKTTGIHRSDSTTEGWTFGRPRDPSVRPAWDAIEREFRRARQRRVPLTDIYGTLLSPPYGMKLGAIPIFVTAALLSGRDDVAIYEHGTFRPTLTPELAERMVRNPAHFEIKH